MDDNGRPTTGMSQYRIAGKDFNKLMSILSVSDDYLSHMKSFYPFIGVIMKYLLMCCTEEKKLDLMSIGECQALMDETVAYCETLRKSGPPTPSNRSGRL